jgi:hypothetical protein
MWCFDAALAEATNRNDDAGALALAHVRGDWYRARAGR